MLELQGQFSYIDRYNKCHFIFIDHPYGDESIEAKSLQILKKTINYGSVFPYDETGFKAFSAAPDLLDVIKKYVGYRVIVKVKPVRYSFKSKLERNEGELIEGTKLLITYLEKI